MRWPYIPGVHCGNCLVRGVHVRILIYAFIRLIFINSIPQNETCYRQRSTPAYAHYGTAAVWPRISISITFQREHTRAARVDTTANGMQARHS